MMLTQPGQVAPRSWRTAGPITLAGDTSRIRAYCLIVLSRWAEWPYLK